MMMRILQAVILITLIPMQTLRSLADKNRVLLIFAPSAQDVRVRQQIKLLSGHSLGMKERDLIALPIFLDRSAPTGADIFLKVNPRPISNSEQLTLRSRFHIAQQDFTLVLVGKDGGEKFRATIPTSIDRIDQIIDAMPMRKDEMKHLHNQS